MKMSSERKITKGVADLFEAVFTDATATASRETAAMVVELKKELDEGNAFLSEHINKGLAEGLSPVDVMQAHPELQGRLKDITAEMNAIAPDTEEILAHAVADMLSVMIEQQDAYREEATFFTVRIPGRGSDGSVTVTPATANSKDKGELRMRLNGVDIIVKPDGAKNWSRTKLMTLFYEERHAVCRFRFPTRQHLSDQGDGKLLQRRRGNMRAAVGDLFDPRMTPAPLGVGDKIEMVMVSDTKETVEISWELLPRDACDKNKVAQDIAASDWYVHSRHYTPEDPKERDRYQAITTGGWASADWPAAVQTAYLNGKTMFDHPYFGTQGAE